MTLPDQLHRHGEEPTAGTCIGSHITGDRLLHLLRCEEALGQIASGSPCVLRPGTPDEHRCHLCHAFIDLAREARGEEPWPAIPHTPVASSPVPQERHQPRSLPCPRPS